MAVRYLEAQIKKDLNRKMVFVGGPRQVGKTTLAKQVLGKKTGYLNWDDSLDRERILKRELPSSKLWVFDEIHKYRSWRNYLKGLFDKEREHHQILVTGSARLDFYRFSGDSLQGRYHYLRMNPISFAEAKTWGDSDLNTLFKFGGFPEPYFEQNLTLQKRWSREYRTRFLKEDLIDLERVQDLGSLELLMLRLPTLVGSPLSINSLREDLQLNFRTVSRWLEILERLYHIFRISPFGAPKIRAVKKEQKHYHYDWTLISDPGIRFENLVAAHLLKWVQFLEDTEGRNVELRFFRDIDGREVDFVIMEEGKPVQFIECKIGDEPISRGIYYLKERFPKVETWQISLQGKKDFEKNGIRVCPAATFLETLV
ncbi:MAG: ATP-binding protein [Proteobacteria bacterium]|nr:ATP-binding protein [Pseudomonadota bacterium]